jgi:NitT/TauT family transport system permease protein
MASATKKVLFYLLILALWEAVYQIRPAALPSPFEVFRTLLEGILEKGYLEGMVVSLRRIAIGYGLSIAAGILLGILLAWSRTLEETMGSAIISLQALPSICWLPLALIWFGLSEGAIIFVVVIGSLLSITMATTVGIKRVPPILTSAARTMGARGLRLHLHVTFPAALPSVVEGMKQGWSFAWRSLMAGELLFVTQGIGHHLAMGRELNDMSQVIAVMLLIVGMGLLVDLFVFATLERRIRERWGLQKG